MEPATWANIQGEFNFDNGCLIDLLVPGTGLAEWESFWAAIRTGPFTVKAFLNEEPISLPESAAWMLTARNENSVLASIQTDEITANCFFFGGDLELDIDPREITNEITFQAVLKIMRSIATAVNLSAFALPEGLTAAAAFLRVSPDGQAIYLPPVQPKTTQV